MCCPAASWIRRRSRGLALRDARLRRSPQGEGRCRVVRLKNLDKPATSLHEHAPDGQPAALISALNPLHEHTAHGQCAAPASELAPHGEERPLAARLEPMRPRRRRRPTRPNECRLGDKRDPLPRRVTPELCIRFALESDGGRREGRALAAPVARLRTKCRRQVPQVWPRTPGLPCATVGTAYTWSPWCAGLVGHHVATMRLRALRWTPASGCQDRTISPCATNRSSARP